MKGLVGQCAVILSEAQLVLLGEECQREGREQKCRVEVLTLSLNLFIMSGFLRLKWLWGTPAGSWRGLTGLGSSVEYPLLTTEFLSLAL